MLAPIRARPFRFLVLCTIVALVLIAAPWRQDRIDTLKSGINTWQGTSDAKAGTESALQSPEGTTEGAAPGPIDAAVAAAASASDPTEEAAAIDPTEVAIGSPPEGGAPAGEIDPPSDPQEVGEDIPSDPIAEAIKGSYDTYDEYEEDEEEAPPKPPIWASPIKSHDSCRYLPGANDVMVVMKTGATESRGRIPVAMETLFRCTPNYLIYSDLEQDIDGQHLFDALDTIEHRVVQNNVDFKFYRNLKKFKQQGKPYEDLLPKNKDDGNPAWNLDKWKNLPMIHKVLEIKPDANWYVFIDADTYLVWSNLLLWLQRLDPNKLHYRGSIAYINDIGFAHGGSGYLISNPMMKKLAEIMTTDRNKFYNLAKHECCGDFLVAKVLKDEMQFGVQDAWPLIQGETPASLDYRNDLWCFPVVTYHHMSVEEQKFMWQWEQDWLALDPKPRPILHRDVFNRVVKPLMQNDMKDWANICLDNVYTAEDVKDDMTAEEKLAHTSIEACRAVCRSKNDCVQLAYLPEKQECRLGNVVRLGKAREGTISGWLVDRIEDHFHQTEPVCHPKWKADFKTPHIPPTNPTLFDPARPPTKAGEVDFLEADTTIKTTNDWGVINVGSHSHGH